MLFFELVMTSLILRQLSRTDHLFFHLNHPKNPFINAVEIVQIRALVLVCLLEDLCVHGFNFTVRKVLQWFLSSSMPDFLVRFGYMFDTFCS